MTRYGLGCPLRIDDDRDADSSRRQARLTLAGQDRYEQGDVWAKVVDLRPAANVLATEQSDKLARAIRRLMTVNTRSVPGLLPEPWVATFEAAGHALASTPCLGSDVHPFDLGS